MRYFLLAIGFVAIGAIAAPGAMAAPVSGSAQTQSQDGKFVQGNQQLAQNNYHSQRQRQNREYRSMSNSANRAYGR